MLNDKENISSFKTARNIWPKILNSKTFLLPRPLFLKSLTFPGLENAFLNSMNPVNEARGVIRSVSSLTKTENHLYHAIYDWSYDGSDL